MLSMQFEIQFIGHRSIAASLLQKYFDKDILVTNDTISVSDASMRYWSILHCDDISLDQNDSGHFVMHNVLITPFLDLSDSNDMLLMHDVLLLFRMSEKLSVDRNCAMRINIAAPIDQRKLSLYFEEYVKCQYDQIHMFHTTVSGPWGVAKPYKYDVCGYELDDIHDILLVILANYATPYDADFEFANHFALNFARVVTDNQIQFRAFNSSFDDAYVMLAANWVDQFVCHCDQIWNNGWRQTYEQLRQIYIKI